MPEPALLSALRNRTGRRYFRDPGLSPRLRIYSRYDRRYFTACKDMGGIAIRHLAPPMGPDILLVIVHLPSKLHQTEHDQALACTRLARTICEHEQSLGHSRTVVVGDLNMDPFEYGVVGAEGLHAIMDRRIAARGARRVQGEDRTFFYNPMWSRLGDGAPGPPGTYYCDTGKQVNFYWNTYDQVLVRPALLSAFDSQDVTVLTEAGKRSLLSDSGRPDAAGASDHLPVLFELDL